MRDRFRQWDRFYHHTEMTGDPPKALKWLRHELWAEKRRAKALKQLADELVLESLAKVSKNTI